MLRGRSPTMMIASFGRYLIYIHSLSTLFAHIKAKFANQGVVCKPRGSLQTKGWFANLWVFTKPSVKFQTKVVSNTTTTS